MFARRHYRAIAAIIADLSLSDDEHSECELAHLETLRRSIASQFAHALKADKPAFRFHPLLRCLQG
jgi:hypothetical protein